MLKNIIKILAIFIIGTVGGIFADQILWPYFIERPLFYEYRLEPPPIYVIENKEIVIQENVALSKAVEKVERTVIGVKTETKTGTVLEGSGLIVSSDGLVVTLANLVPHGSSPSFFINGKEVGFQVEKRDPDKNLALIKVNEGNLPTVGFANSQALKRGQRVFLVGVIFLNGLPEKIVNEGIIKFFEKDFIRTNIFEKKILEGSPLFDIEGKVLGINTIDTQGKVTAIPISKIREFISF